MESMNEFWARCQAKLKDLVRSTPSIYQLWFGVLEPVSWDPALGKLTLPLGAGGSKSSVALRAHRHVVRPVRRRCSGARMPG